jgi:organic hydroperoxide reductase OsmC/OhrA
MAFPLQYQTRYEWSGNGETGHVGGPGLPALAVGVPEASVSDQGENRWNPEALLLAAVEICLFNTFAYIAAMSKLSFRAYESTANGEVELVQREGYKFKNIVVKPKITVAAADAERARRIIDKAHNACLISRSLNFAVEVGAEIISA